MISYPFTAKPILDTEGNPVLDVNGFPTYDRTIDSAMERAFNKQKWTNGVYSYPTDGLQVVAKSGMTVTAKIGGCQIEGAQGYNETDLDILLSDANATLDRIDRIVVRFNLNDAVRSIEIYKKEGVAGTTPEAPSITQESNYYELVLADIMIEAGATEITQANITDQRLNSELCGVVIPAIPTPLDTSTLYNQYQDSLDQYLSLVASAINETLAGELQTNIDAVQDNVDDSNGKIQLVQKYNVVTAVTNGDFKCTLTGLSTLTSGDVVKISFPSATLNTSVARLSIDGGTNYKNIYDELNSANILASEIENQSLELRYNGIQFVNTNTSNNVKLLGSSGTAGFVNLGAIDLTKYSFLMLAINTLSNRQLASGIITIEQFKTGHTSEATAYGISAGDYVNYTASSYYSSGNVYIYDASVNGVAKLYGIK